MSITIQLSLPNNVAHRLTAKAMELGITPTEYVRRMVGAVFADSRPDERAERTAALAAKLAAKANKKTGSARYMAESKERILAYLRDPVVSAGSPGTPTGREPSAIGMYSRVTVDVAAALAELVESGDVVQDTPTTYALSEAHRGA